MMFRTLTKYGMFAIEVRYALTLSYVISESR